MAGGVGDGDRVPTAGALPVAYAPPPGEHGAGGADGAQPQSCSAAHVRHPGLLDERQGSV
ncbi:hypothetical protein [Fodinicola feengrottensis]|uniref:hypothetical protein n=1 Tax=Fodinicola feengrottensis TaxID=435914 RepID=UPI00244268AE|nr:hypothetical protein [Fodinicola feengrottensis]